MSGGAVKIRRGRREDFHAIRELLLAEGLQAPPPDRAAIRRFRNMVADLGTDLYVADSGGQPVGMIYCTYARQLSLGQLARIEHLLVSDSHRDSGIEASLLAFIAERARKRSCARLCCVPTPTTPVSDETLRQAGLVPKTTEYCLALDAGD